MRYQYIKSLSILAGLMLLFLTGCGRERPSSKPPIHLNPNMDSQEKYKAQAQNKFFPDSSAMRMPVAGTVMRGELREDEIFYRGYTGDIVDSQFVKKAPVEITLPLLKRGRERFDIFCSPCHSRVGDGKGIMVTRGYVPPPNFHDDRIRTMPDGYIYEVIVGGVRNMPSYRHQINTADRWAIVIYLRALQRSQQAALKDIPEEL
ncbi:MAG: c-type cytochrome, partial [Candidatus Zixiibacteriota bacterium]